MGLTSTQLESEGAPDTMCRRQPTLRPLGKPPIDGYLVVAKERRIPIAKPGHKRRFVDPTTTERQYSADEIEFMKAMDAYKRDNHRPYPTWSEVLDVFRSLGWKKGVAGA